MKSPAGRALSAELGMLGRSNANDASDYNPSKIDGRHNSAVDQK